MVDPGEINPQPNPVGPDELHPPSQFTNTKFFTFNSDSASNVVPVGFCSAEFLNDGDADAVITMSNTMVNQQIVLKAGTKRTYPYQTKGYYTQQINAAGTIVRVVAHY